MGLTAIMEQVLVYGNVVVQQALLYAHVIFFALAMAAILKEDVRLLLSKRLDFEALHSTARTIKWLLIALWATGVPMVVIDIGTDVAMLLGKPKLMVKIAVVTVLTLNGVLLHMIAFPMLINAQRNPRKAALAATVASILGAVSTTSWLYASFLGVARLIAPHLSFRDFASLYGIAIIGAISVATFIVRDRLERMLNPQSAAGRERDSEGQRLVSSFGGVYASVPLPPKLILSSGWHLELARFGGNSQAMAGGAGQSAKGGPKVKLVNYPQKRART